MGTRKLTTVAWQTQSTPQELHEPLRTLGKHYPIREAAKEGISLSFSRSHAGDALLLERRGGAASVKYPSPAAALRAVGGLMAGIVGEEATYRERAPFETFGIMLDCSRNAVMRVDHLMGWLGRLALLGYNMVMLYTEDTYALPGEPYFGYQRGAYTAEELQEIDAYAAQLGIEMIPCIQTLGHLEQILRWPAYSEVRDTSSVMLVDEAQTYELIGKMLDHWAAVFKSKRIHVGMDETHDLGRGRFMDRSGYEQGFDIFNRHLERVTAMCRERGLAPMIWSDMYFRLGSQTGDYYDLDCEIPEDVAAAIPSKAELVYWDYYHADKGFYLDWIQRHRALGHEPLVASGVWTWGKLWYDHYLTEANAGACIDACREAGVREIFFTLWGDDGGYCDFDSAFAGLAYVAERAFADTVDPDVLRQRFYAIFGADYQQIRAMSEINAVLSPAALWDDPLLAIYLAHERAQDSDALTRAADSYRRLCKGLSLASSGGTAGDLTHAAAICDALAAKVALAEQLMCAYAEEDKQGLRFAREEIPAVKERITALLQSFRHMWLVHNKPFGLEVPQIRLGGLLARYDELEARLGEYLSGGIADIPELAANAPSAPGGPLGRTGYRYVASGSLIL